MASSNANESPTKSKTCQSAEGDKNISNIKASENSDKQSQNCPDSQIIKSGPLCISSKGIGWTSWKKRWFVLTSTSLVFYRSDPNAPPQKGIEANPTLGGIDLNNSGSVIIKEDKKLLTVFFPDGRDGRTFTLKGETIDELQEWKTALESALAQAPSAGLAMGQNGIFRNELADPVEDSSEQSCDKQPVKSMVIGRPVILALQEVDGSPSFLEKALRFIEEYGIKVEGILRQSADVEEVERRVQDYEMGRDEFSADEDAHVIGDCIKHVLREMPSSPVPASCCTALVEAYRTDRGNRIRAIRRAISETFPEPNLRLLQRCLDMMQIVESHKAENRMSLSALAACMAPLLLRPLLAGECEFEDNFNMGGDGSLQLLKAAAAANHAQAIVIILLEEYDRIFDDELMEDGSYSSEIYTESEEDDYIEDDESSDNDMEDDEHHDSENEADSRDDLDHSASGSGTLSGSSSYHDSYLSDNQEEVYTHSSSTGDTEDDDATEAPSSTLDDTTLGQDIGQKNDVMLNKENGSTGSPRKHANDRIGDINSSTSPTQKSVSHTAPRNIPKFSKKSIESIRCSRRRSKRGNSNVRKNLSVETIYYSNDDETAIQALATTKSDLQTKIAKEVKENANLQASLERRKEDLHERRLELEKDVEKLREQLQKERNLKASLESGLMNIRPGHVSITPNMDSKTRADLEEINLVETEIVQLKQKAADLRGQLSQHAQPNYGPLCISCNRHLHETEKDHQKNSVTNDVSSLSSAKNVQAQRQDLPSTKIQTSEKTTGASSIEQSSTVQSMSLPNKFSRTEETVSSSANSEDAKTKHGKDKQPTNRQEKRWPLGSRSTSTKNSSNNSTSKGENSKFGADLDTEPSKAQNQSLPTLSDAQPSHKLPRQATNQGKNKCKDASSTEEPATLVRNFATKKSFVKSDNEKESQDTTTFGIISASKKSYKSEDEASSAPSSSALSRLTNRLHFLKERRVQLVKELQNLDTTQASRPELPARTVSQ